MLNSERRRKIRQLTRLDLERCSYDAVKKIYGELTEGTHSVSAQTPGHELFFRVRLNPPEKPLLISELGAPPTSIVTGYQRCNPPGQPMFYAASRRDIALREVRPAVGDIAYLCQWIGRVGLPYCGLFEELGEAADRLLTQADHILLSHAETIFTRRVHETFSNDYKLTAALTEQLTQKYPTSEDHKIAEDGLVALRYPSVFDLEGAYNTVMYPDFAERHLDLTHVCEVRVVDISRTDMEVEILDNAKTFNNGNIEWSSNPNAIPISRGSKGEVAFKKMGDKGHGHWEIAVVEASITNEMVKEFLVEQSMIRRGFGDQRFP